MAASHDDSALPPGTIGNMSLNTICKGTMAEEKDALFFACRLPRAVGGAL